MRTFSGFDTEQFFTVLIRRCNWRQNWTNSDVLVMESTVPKRLLLPYCMFIILSKMKLAVC